MVTECLRWTGISGKVNWWVLWSMVLCARLALCARRLGTLMHIVRHITQEGMDRIQSTFLCIINAYYSHHRKRLLFVQWILDAVLRSFQRSARYQFSTNTRGILILGWFTRVCMYEFHEHCCWFLVFIFGHNERRFVLINVYLSPLIDF